MKFFWRKKQPQHCTILVDASSGYAFGKKISNIRNNIYSRLLSITLLVLLVLWVSFSCKQNHIFPIRKVQLIANFNHVDKGKIQQILNSYLQSGFFAFNAKNLSAELMNLPWVHNVSVQRLWPDKIVLLIDEQVPLAKWNNISLLNTDGEIFTPDKDTLPNNLPQLSGEDNELQEITNNYFSMQQILRPVGYTISQLVVDQHHNWYLILNNGLRLFLGQKDVLTRTKLFTSIYPKIKAKGKTARQVDLRYNNGLAIDWVESNSNEIKNQ